jgi:hypothetical protein
MDMPKELTHWLLAERAFTGLERDSHLRGVIESHRSAYLGGAVLPDTLLHLFRGPHAATALALAHSFHDTSDNSFAPLIRVERCFPDGLPPPLLACLLGVITHIETDIIFHPYVYALTGKGGIGRHYQIETCIDNLFLSNGTIPAVKHFTELIVHDTQTTLIDTCMLLFDPDGTLTRPAFEQALTLHCRFQALYDSTFWKLIVRFLAKIKGSPFREQQHLFYPISSSTGSSFEIDTREWRHPISGELQQSTPEELADKTVQCIIELFTQIETEGSLATALGSRPGENLLTGLLGVSLEEMDRVSSAENSSK